MFTLKEKQYLLELLQREKRRAMFGMKKKPPEHQKLVEKLEQMVRNERVNQKHL
ncbi:hypothetical protein IDH44_00580 [Paenibacillus sp. IB182496]|uniref:Uncharacterized protein n=1 Tax=Paenibacillus sabuli TaxID=2772509 RepID=A0A927BQF8_9BACL|nr:hypothetical protein [Paenibacillus sabuli]MBD2843669.1 hypothetical protein [Paenibacillus sabuli]